MRFPLRNVLNEETVRVVPRQKHFAHNAADAFFAEVEVVSTHQRGVDEIKANRVGTKLVADLDGVGVVLKAFAHLFAVLGEHEPVYDKVFVRVTVFDPRGNHVQSVEPSSRLVDAFPDEVGRENLSELFFGSAEGVMDLGEGHGATLEPTVEDFLNAAQFSLSPFALNREVVDAFAMQVSDSCACELLELLD